ncbi:DUF1992 domain-containing protein [Paenibacillus larvae]
MDVFSMIAEQKIQEAIQKGEMDNLPGQGKPLVLENWSSVPEDLRLAYKILKTPVTFRKKCSCTKRWYPWKN